MRIYTLKYFALICCGIIFHQCSNSDKLHLVNFENKGCEEEISIDEGYKLQDRITDISTKDNTLNLTIFFVEDCGFVIDPELKTKEDTILIKLDKEIDNPDVQTIYALCFCCYSVKLELANIENERIDKLTYQIRKQDKYPKTIEYTQEKYRLFSIDFVVIDKDTIFYQRVPEEDLIRSYSNEYEDGSPRQFSYFPDKEELFYKEWYPSYGNIKLHIEGGIYEKRDIDGEIIEIGKVKYDTLDIGNNKKRGIKVKFIKE